MIVDVEFTLKSIILVQIFEKIFVNGHRELSEKLKLLQRSQVYLNSMFSNKQIEIAVKLDFPNNNISINNSTGALFGKKMKLNFAPTRLLVHSLYLYWLITNIFLEKFS